MFLVFHQHVLEGAQTIQAWHIIMEPSFNKENSRTKFWSEVVKEARNIEKKVTLALEELDEKNNYNIETCLKDLKVQYIPEYFNHPEITAVSIPESVH
jgi:hypothetical protein